MAGYTRSGRPGSIALAACALLLLGNGPAPRLASSASPASQLSDADTASEYWDLAAVFESGHRLFGRFSISNEGPGSRTAFALGQIVFPDGTIVPFKNGRRDGSWKLSPDGLRIKIGSSLLDLHDGPGAAGAAGRRLEVDNDRRGIKVFLRFDGAPPGLSWDAAPSGYSLDLLHAGVPVHGTLWARGVVDEPVAVRGTLSATHAWMDATESRLVQRRIELRASVASPPHPEPDADGLWNVYLVQVEPPAAKPRCWLVVERDGAVVAQTGTFDVALEGSGSGDERAYPVPARLSLRGPGVRGEVRLRRSLVRHDPLSIAPAPFRWFLGLRMKPIQLWLEADFDLHLGGTALGEDRPLAGAGVVSLFYLNPVS